MEIKVKYKGQVVGEIEFLAYSTIQRMREMGYASFSVRSQVNKYEYFAIFKNEDTDDYVCIYPDLSFNKRNECKVKYKELCLIKEVIDNYINYTPIEEESE